MWSEISQWCALIWVLSIPCVEHFLASPAENWCPSVLGNFISHFTGDFLFFLFSVWNSQYSCWTSWTCPPIFYHFLFSMKKILLFYFLKGFFNFIFQTLYCLFLQTCFFNFYELFFLWMFLFKYITFGSLFIDVLSSPTSLWILVTIFIWSFFFLHCFCFLQFAFPPICLGPSATLEILLGCLGFLGCQMETKKLAGHLGRGEGLWTSSLWGDLGGLFGELLFWGWEEQLWVWLMTVAAPFN